MRSTFDISPAELVRDTGGALPLDELLDAGCVRPAIDADLGDGRLIRVRRGWYATPDAPPDVIRAARVGGALTAASAARLHHLWLLDDPLLHVRVPSTAARLRSPSDASAALNREAHGVCVHYRTVESNPFEGDLPARDGLARSLAEMFRCAGTVPAMVALESALNRGALPMQGLESIRGLVPTWAHRQLDLASPDSDSGLETITRLLFVRRHVRVRTQVFLAGVRRVDLLVGDRLVIELDGRAFHSGEDFERDRIQDLELALRGYLVVRLSYRMVTSDWDRTHRAVHELVARELHRWGRPAREGGAFRVDDAGDWALSSL
jgi:very-short-patch-repair endonuclease